MRIKLFSAGVLALLVFQTTYANPAEQNLNLVEAVHFEDIVPQDSEKVLLAGWTAENSKYGREVAYVSSFHLGRQETLWEQTLDLGLMTNAWAVRIDEGNRIFVGGFVLYEETGWDAFVAEIFPETNDEPRVHILKAPGDQRIWDMEFSGDGSLILFGEEKLRPDEFTSILIVKLNKSGEVLWTKGTGSKSENTRGFGLVNSGDGLFRGIGSSANASLDHFTPYFLVFDQDGSIVIENENATMGSVLAHDIAETGNSTFLIGYGDREGLGKTQANLLGVDPEGNVNSFREFGSNGNARGVTMNPCGADKLIVAGYHQQEEIGGNWDGLIFEVPAQGEGFQDLTLANGEFDIAARRAICHENLNIAVGYIIKPDERVGFIRILPRP